MPRLVPCLSALLLAGVALPAAAQVYRCGDSRVYTDQVCSGASAVDVRPNLLNGGTRQIPADPPPAPAVIPPSSYDPPRVGDSSGNMWDTRDARDAEYRARTGPYHP